MTNSTHTRRKATAGKGDRFTTNKFLWLDQVSEDDKLPPLAMRACVKLCNYFNRKYDGEAWPTQETLANALGVNREAINRAMKILAARGHLEITATRGRHRPNTYRLALKTTADRPEMCAATHIIRVENVRFSTGKCAPARTQNPFKNPINPPGPLKRPRREGREMRRARSAITSASV